MSPFRSLDDVSRWVEENGVQLLRDIVSSGGFGDEESRLAAERWLARHDDREGEGNGRTPCKGGR